MRLPNSVYEMVNQRVEIFYASRDTTAFWNSNRGSDLRYFTGHYWYEKDGRGRAISGEQHGPFKSEAAAYRDAFIYFAMRLPDGVKALPAPQAAKVVARIQPSNLPAVIPPTVTRLASPTVRSRGTKALPAPMKPGEKWRESLPESRRRARAAR